MIHLDEYVQRDYDARIGVFGYVCSFRRDQVPGFKESSPVAAIARLRR